MSSQRSSISATVVADSLFEESRLTTFEVTFPRFILAEFNTHRVFSRNSASSRAIPVWKRLIEVLEHPFVPLQFGKNKAGMQADEGVSEDTNQDARRNWLVGRDVAVIQALFLAGGIEQIMRDSKGNEKAQSACDRIIELTEKNPYITSKMRHLPVGVHKQHANRVLEPYAFHTVIVTGNQWRNFYGLRASPLAQPEIQELAIAMARAHFLNDPKVLNRNDWHLPFVFPEDSVEVEDPILLARISSARCARVSYLTHDGKRSIESDLSMADKLQQSGHMSPFEHPAEVPSPGDIDFWGGHQCGNFDYPWRQYRKKLINEDDFSTLISHEALLEGLGGDQELVDFVLSLRE